MNPINELTHMSILSNFDKAEIHLEPYPYIVIKNALPVDLYNSLESSFPSVDLVADGREIKDDWYDYPACKVTQDERFTQQWRDFFRYHTSDTFFYEFIDKLGQALRELHPELESEMGKPFKQFVVGMRPGGKENPMAEGADISMECQFYINLTKQLRTVRGPHLDRPSELFAGLLYFRCDDDESEGGNLAVQAAKSESTYPQPGTVRIDTLPLELAPEKVTTLNTVKYEANTLVLFLNSEHSIHAVTPRSATQIPRRHINFCGDITQDLFDLSVPQKLQLQKAIAKIRRLCGW